MSQPVVAKRRAETIRPDSSAGGVFRENVKEREFVRDILNLNVVGNHVTLQPCAQRFAKLWLCIDQKSFRRVRL